MKKRILSLLLAMLLCVSLLPAAALADTGAAAGGTVPDDWSYTLDEEGGSVILENYTGTAAAVTVPASLEIEGRTYPVLISSRYLFRGNTTLRSVTLEGGVGFKDNSMRSLFYECSALTRVDLSAVDTSDVVDMSFMFYKCTALQTLDLSAFDTSKVTAMRAMFYYCKKLSGLTGYEDWDTGSLEDMYMTFCQVAYSVKASTQVRIDLSRWDLSRVKNCGWCFQQCRAQEIIVPEGLTIMSAGFMNHAIRYAGASYTIPASVTKIGYAHTFYDFATDDFTEFRVAEGNTCYQVIDGILYSADGTEMLGIPRNKPFADGVYEIPEGVTFLAELSFSRNYNIHTVVLPDSYEIGYVPVYDPRYITFEDHGNLNAGTNLSIAIYCYTGVTAYAVKDSNPRYASLDGVIYSKDMTHVVAIPARYDRTVTVPEGVTDWDLEAMWADGSDTVDNLLANCPGVSLPATLTRMSDDQLEMLNRLHANRAGGDNPFTITLAEGCEAFHVDEDGFLRYAITVTSQPEDVNVPLGTIASTAVKAEGEGLTYVWYGRDPGQTDFWKSSIKTDTYSVRMVSAKIGREVYCVITDAAGHTVTTRTAVLGVEYPEDYAPPAVTVPAADMYADDGETVRVRAEASGDGLTYQWYGRDPGETGFWKSSIKSNTYNVTMVPKKSGREIYCVVTDRYGSTAQSDVVTLHMQPAADYRFGITVQPQSTSAAPGEAAVVSLTAEGKGLTYTWYGRDPGETDFWKSSIKSSKYNITMVPKKSGREVYCVVTDQYGNTEASDIVTLTMLVEEDYSFGITGQPQNVSVSEGETARTAVTAEGDGLTYQWYGKDPGQTDFWKSSIKSAAYACKMTEAKNGRVVYCVVTDRYGNTAESGQATLCVKSPGGNEGEPIVLAPAPGDGELPIVTGSEPEPEPEPEPGPTIVYETEEDDDTPAEDQNNDPGSGSGSTPWYILEEDYIIELPMIPIR